MNTYFETPCSNCGKLRKLRKQIYAKKSNRCKSCSAKARTKEQIKLAGLTRRKHSDSDIQEALDAITLGMSWQKASKTYNISKETLERRSKELGFHKRGHLPSRKAISLNLPTNRESIGYLAALIDGEGNITTYRNKRLCFQICISNTSPELMRWLSSIGGKTYWRKRNTNICSNPKKIASWMVVARKDVLYFLKNIVNWLIIKKQKAEAVINELDNLLNKEKG